MFQRTCYATHPDMMACASNADLRERYLIDTLVRPGACVLNYTHADRMVIGGVEVVDAADAEARLPDQVSRRPPPAVRFWRVANWASSMSARHLARCLTGRLAEISQVCGDDPPL